MSIDRRRNPLAVLSGADRAVLLVARDQPRPFLAYRGEEGRLAAHVLEGLRVSVGRSEKCDIWLSWDPAVSETSLELTRAGSRWRVEDLGSNPASLTRPQAGETDGFLQLAPDQRYLLQDGDLLQVGDVRLCFCAAPRTLPKTVVSEPLPPPLKVTPAERKLLLELCRPRLEASGSELDVGTPSNEDLSEVLGIGVRMVVRRIGALATRFGLGDLPPGRKREALATLAIATGVVGPGSIRK